MAAASAPGRVLYVGGVDQSVTVATLRAAFIPFGTVTEVTLPPDPSTSELDAGAPCEARHCCAPAGGHRGFAFVAFADEDDANEAIFNMNGAELFGRVLRVNVARQAPMGARGPVWEEADKWYASMGVEGVASSSAAAAVKAEGKEAEQAMLRSGPAPA
jgi:peptidyl-prolyl isomerase E (cyclophilin E)